MDRYRTGAPGGRPPGDSRAQPGGRESVAVRVLRSARGPAAAWALNGSGEPTLVLVSGWITHLTADWSSRQIGAWHRGLARSHRVLRYDRPGTGMADRNGHDFSLRAEVDLLDRVLSAAGEHEVVLVGTGLGGPIAIAFAARYPARVAKLVLIDTSACICAEHDGINPDTVEALAQLAIADWGLASRTLSELILPAAGLDEHRWFTDYQRGGAPPAAGAAMLRALRDRDVRLLLRTVEAPVLVVHHHDNPLIPLGAAHALADGLTRARLLVLVGAQTVPWGPDAGTLVSRIRDFVRPPGGVMLTPRESEIMNLVSRGLGNRATGARLGITESTVARHLANVYLKLDVDGRVAAIERLRALGQAPLDGAGLRVV